MSDKCSLACAELGQCAVMHVYHTNRQFLRSWVMDKIILWPNGVGSANKGVYVIHRNKAIQSIDPCVFAAWCLQNAQAPQLASRIYTIRIMLEHSLHDAGLLK